jgi:hypothetical protein
LGSAAVYLESERKEKGNKQSSKRRGNFGNLAPAAPRAEKPGQRPTAAQWSSRGEMAAAMAGRLHNARNRIYDIDPVVLQ